MKYIKIVFLASLMLVCYTGFGQSMKEADHAFEHEAYKTAIDLYKKAYTKEKDKAKKAKMLFSIAECYREMEEEQQAEVWFKKALQAQYPDPISNLHLADALRCQEKYDEAEEYYKKYKSLRPDDDHADRGIQSCEEAKKWKAEPTKHVINNEVILNTPQYDYAPSYFSHDYTKLVFTSTRPASTGDATHGRTGHDFADLFYSERDEKGKWSTPVPMASTINSIHEDGFSTFTADKTAMYFTRCKQEKGKYLGCHIYRSTYNGSSWTESTEVKLSEIDTIVFGHPAVSADATHLFFASDMPGGKGGKDIWFVTYDKATDTYSAPTNVSGINTPKNEMFPYYREDGELFFASDGHVGMGGLDIFKAQKIGNDQWGQVENMQYPINSPMNDFGLIMEDEDERGYFTSNRIGGKGHDDIYSFYIPPMVFFVDGTVVDVDTGEPLEGAIVKLVGSDGSMVEKETDASGYYKFADIEGEEERYVKPNVTYSMEISKEMYLVSKGEFTTVGHEESVHFEENFEMQSITKDEIEFPEVLYDLAKWSLRPESKDSLNFLYQVLIDNPTIVIELSAHTDARGSDKYNLDLSQKRAQSCVDYLIEKGIDKDRLVPKGYGENSPIFSESDIKKLKTEEEREAAHQKNRRTVFKVLRDDFVPKGNTEEGSN